MPSSERRKKITIQASQICPLCREKVHREEVLSVCPGCQAVYHRECSGELASGRCTTLGCRYSRRRTASGRTPHPPTPPQRPPLGRRQPLTFSERVLRGAMVLGAVVAFVFLAIHLAESIESRGRERAITKQRSRRARVTRLVLASYRNRATQLKEYAKRQAPPSAWRFPKLSFELDDTKASSKPNAAVLSWNQLGEPREGSPLGVFYPAGFQLGLSLSVLSPKDNRRPKWALDARAVRAHSARYLIAVRVESLRPAEEIRVRAGRVRPRSSKVSHSKEDALEAGLWPTGEPPHAQAEVVLRAYLYDFEASPGYKGCLEIRGRSPKDYRARRDGDESWLRRDRPGLYFSPTEQKLRDELRRSGLELGVLPHADIAALEAAYLELRSELESDRR